MAERKQTGELLARYLGKHWGCDCALVNIEQIPGGASRETYLVQLLRDGDPVGVVMRRDPPSSLIDTERALEYRTYEAIHQHGVMPVPEPIVLEESPGELLRPFSVMALVAEGQASPTGLDEPVMDPVRGDLAHRKWSMLGRMASQTPEQLGVGFMPAPEHPARHELDYWRNVIDTDALHPQPIAQAALRWLERNLPEPGRHLTLVHGDFRTGNYLYTPQGEITAVLDWEMAHLGDPLEDLAWSLDPLWSPQPAIAGRLASRADAMAIWQAASGLSIEPDTFRWWQVFASVKALAIWISSAEDYVHGTTKEPILAFAGWPMMDRQNRILLDRISPLSTNEIAEPLA